LNSRQIVERAKTVSADKNGLDLVVLDLKKVSDIADYFVLVSGTSNRHVSTIAEAVIKDLEGEVRPNHVEGLTEGSWALVDYGSVMVHVFHYSKRKFYNLERLWGNTHLTKTVRTRERKPKKNR